MTGTPSTAGAYTTKVTAMAASYIAGSATYRWDVVTALTVPNPGTQYATVGQAASRTMAAASGTSPYTWTATGLPTGLSISSAGVISGTPTTAGTVTVTATARDAAGRTASTSFSWVTAAAVRVTNPGTRQATVGTATSLTLAATGGSAPYTWTAR